MKPSAWMLCLAAVALGACAEKPQTADTKKFDAKPWEGVAGSNTSAAGWKAGDQAAWEELLRTRAQHGQNEYTRTAATR